MHGHCETYLVPILLERSEVEALLPSRVKLGRLPGSLDLPDRDKHVVILEFNHQERVVDLLGVRHRYHEFILNIPYVEIQPILGKRREPLSYMRILYLDDLMALLGGRIFWHFQKVPGNFQISPDQDSSKTTIELFEVIEGKRLVEAQFTKDGPEIDSNLCRNFQTLRPMFELTAVTRGMLGSLYTTRYSWDLTDVPIQPAVTALHTAKALVAEWRVLDCSVESISKQQLGSFWTSFNWTLTPALPLGRFLRMVNAVFWDFYKWLKSRITRAG
jgi:hypothetical protein